MKPPMPFLFLILTLVAGLSAWSPPAAQAGATEVLLATGCPIKRQSDGAIIDVDLSERTVDDEVVDALAALPNLSVLRLRRTAISDAQLSRLTGLKLRMIDLRITNITDKGMVALGAILSLVDIQLEKTKVTDAGIEKLAGLKLKSFNVNYCTSISNRGLAVLAAMPSIEQLQLDYTKIDDKGMAGLAGATR